MAETSGHLGAVKLALASALVAAAVLPAAAEDNAFSSWLDRLRAEALERGIAPAVLDEALGRVQPIPRIIELDRKQPEFTLTYQEYLDRVVPPARVETGRERLRENRVLLERIAAKYRVQPRFVVALWGIETDFGRLTGSFKVVDALVTLAYDGRRSEYFRRELMDALTILDEGHISNENMVGSWAGAMGQNQFMPSSFRRYAVDFDGNGRRDIWTSKDDVLASAANYLASNGWRSGQTWGREVRLPAGIDPALAEQKARKPLAEWQALGVRRADGGDLPTQELEAMLVLPAGKGGPAYLVYANFETILKWNRSTFFGLAVGRLADQIGTG